MSGKCLCGTKDKDAYHESSLLVDGLEFSVAKLRGSIDKLEVDLFQGSSLGLHKEGLNAKRKIGFIRRGTRHK